jgi:hypothetical protein
MEENQQNNSPMTEGREEENEENNKDDKYFFSNVFSKIGNFEKNKRYIQLQNDLDLLKQNVRLMEEFTNKEKLGKRKNYTRRISWVNPEKDNNNKINISKRLNNIIMRKKNILDKSNSVNNGKLDALEVKKKNKNINRNTYKNINKKDMNIIINRSSNMSLQNNKMNKNKIYKTELNNYSKLINGQQLPNILLGLDKGNESNTDIKNTNENDSSTLPIIQDYNKTKKSSRNRVIMLADNNIDYNRDLSINSNDKIIHYKKIPAIRKNLTNNTFVQNFPSILNSKRSNNADLNHKELPIQTDKMVRKMKEKNVKIKNKINHKLIKQNLIDWEMKSKFKLVQWKYGIAEVQKYFVDLQAYGKPEEVELLKRKTFYDYLEELVDDIKKTKEEKELKAIENKYGINSGEKNKFGDVKKEKEKEENNDINAVETAINKKREFSEALKKVKKRRIKEDEKRKIIERIIFDSDTRRKAINNSTNKLKHQKYTLNRSNESTKNNISKKSYQNDNNISKTEIGNE